MPAKDKKTPCVYVLALGGTIASVAKNPDNEFYDTPTTDIKDLIASLQLPKEITVRSEQLLQQLSQDMTDKDLFLVANRVNDLADSDHVSGIVITQGTNCIEEIAYFISLIVKTKKPIVFTGSFRPVSALGYDGLRNLYNAIIIASSPKAKDIGVVLTFNDAITSARDSSKLNPSIVNDFSGMGLGLLGHVQDGAVHIARLLQHRHTSNSEFNIAHLKHFPKIYIMYGHFGIDDVLVKTAITNKVAGIISAGMGEGHQPQTVTDALALASQNNIIVIRCSRTGYGVVSREPEIDDTHRFIAGGTLSPQKARILLSVALSKTKDKDEIQRIFAEY